MTIAPNDRRYPEFTVGWRLRLSRTLLGPDMDVRAFADLLGVSKNTVTAYELEQTAPERMKPLVLSAWALATGVDLDWLRTGVRPEEPTTPGDGADLQHREAPADEFLPETRWFQRSIRQVPSGSAA